MLAAWVSMGASSGAKEVGAIMGHVNWDDAPALVFPQIALPLFTADVAHATGVKKQTVKGGASGGPLEMGILGTPCTSLSNFAQSVLDTVYKALMLNAPTGTTIVAQVGGFFVTLWNTAVSFAKTVITGLANTLGGGSHKADRQHRRRGRHYGPDRLLSEPLDG